MRIGYYIHHTSLKAGGIFTYSIGILKLLIKSNEIEKIHLIISSDQENYFQEFQNSLKVEFKIIDRKNLLIKIRFTLSYILFNIIAVYRNFFKKSNQLKLLSKLPVLLNPYCKYVNSSQIDLLHIPFQYAPIYNTDVPLIITMHDIQEFHYPEYFSALQKFHRKMNNITALNESNHIIVSFDHIKRDLINYLNVKEKKISVCAPPFTEDWFLSEEFTPENELRDKYQIKNDFILYPAATWKHKNHTTLFKVLYQLKNEKLNIELICTGNKTEYFEDLQSEIVNLGLGNQAKFLGIVPEEDLIGLYKCTSLVVIPTKYEAGSGPLYEAMRYSSLVICSNVTSLPETMDNEKFVFNPDDVDELTALIRKMLTDETLKKLNRANSKRRIGQLKPIDYSKNFIDVFKKLI